MIIDLILESVILVLTNYGIKSTYCNMIFYNFKIRYNFVIVYSLTTKSTESVEEFIPEWVKNNAAWWSDGLISEDDFLNGIKYLVKKGVIQV